MKILQIKSIYMLFVLFISFFQIGCIDLAGLREFTDNSVKVGTKFKGVLNDSYRSCAIKLYYQELNDTEFKDYKLFESPSLYLEHVPEAQKLECERTKKSSTNFIGANKVLMTYLYVMGQLADEGLANTDDEFTALQSSIAEIPGANNSIVSPTLNLITNIILEIKQKKALKEVINKNNSDVEKLTDGLSASLDIYLERLTREKDALKDMFIIAQKLHSQFNQTNNEAKPKFDALQLLSSGISIEDKIQTIDEKTSAAKAYQEVLAGIKKAHQELYAESNKSFDKKNVIRIALKYAPMIQTNYDEIIKVF